MRDDIIAIAIAMVVKITNRSSLFLIARDRYALLVTYVTDIGCNKKTEWSIIPFCYSC